MLFCKTQTKIFICILLSALFCQHSFAEGILMEIKPRANEVVSGFDGNIKAAFSGNVSERSPSLVVVNDQGERVDHGDAKLAITDERSVLTATAPSLNPGKYVIRYRVVTDDGLIVSGISHFSIKP